MDSVAKHILIDFENVRGMDTALLLDSNVTFTLLLGAGQTKLGIELVQELLLHATSVQLVRLTSRGKNALDFALAYYLGQAVAMMPQAAFYIISKDKGFDPLIEHLLTRNIRIARREDFAQLAGATPASSASSPKPKPSPKKETAASNPGVTLSDQAMAQLRKVSANRPKSRKSLLSFLTTHLGADMTDAGAAAIMAHLVQAGKLSIDPKGAVTYTLEEA